MLEFLKSRITFWSRKPDARTWVGHALLVTVTQVPLYSFVRTIGFVGAQVWAAFAAFTYHELQDLEEETAHDWTDHLGDLSIPVLVAIVHGLGALTFGLPYVMVTVTIAVAVALVVPSIVKD